MPPWHYPVVYFGNLGYLYLFFTSLRILCCVLGIVLTKHPLLGRVSSVQNFPFIDNLSVNWWMPKHFEISLYPFAALCRSSTFDNGFRELLFERHGTHQLMLPMNNNHKIMNVVYQSSSKPHFQTHFINWAPCANFWLQLAFYGFTYCFLQNSNGCVQ